MRTCLSPRQRGLSTNDCERVVGKYEAAGAAGAGREISRHVGRSLLRGTWMLSSWRTSSAPSGRDSSSRTRRASRSQRTRRATVIASLSTSASVGGGSGCRRSVDSPNRFIEGP